MRFKNSLTTMLIVILSASFSACSDNTQGQRESSKDSGGAARISIEGNVYELPFVTCQPPHPETKAYTVMALEIEDDIAGGASFRSFGTQKGSTIAFSLPMKMDDEGYNTNPIYSARDAVNYSGDNYQFSGSFRKVVNGKDLGAVEGSAEVACK